MVLRAPCIVVVLLAVGCIFAGSTLHDCESVGTGWLAQGLPHGARWASARRKGALQLSGGGDHAAVESEGEVEHEDEDEGFVLSGPDPSISSSGENRDKEGPARNAPEEEDDMADETLGLQKEELRMMNKMVD